MSDSSVDKSFRFLVEAETGAVRILRGRLRARLEDSRVGSSATNTLLLVVDELVNNAIDHGGEYREHRDRLEVEIDVSPDRVTLRFRDPSAPDSVIAELERQFDGSVDSVLPELDLERGRGLFLIASCLTDLAIRAAETGGLLVSGSVARS